MPLPPLLLSVASVFNGLENWLQQTSPSYQRVVAFKLITFSWEETVAAYGVLTAMGPQDTLTGLASKGDDEVTYEHDTGWVGNPFHALPFATKQAVTAKLITQNGVQVLSLEIKPPNSTGPNQFRVTLNANGGTDPYLTSAPLLTGTRDTVPGRALVTFFKTEFEKSTPAP